MKILDNYIKMVRGVIKKNPIRNGQLLMELFWVDEKSPRLGLRKMFARGDKLYSSKIQQLFLDEDEEQIEKHIKYLDNHFNHIRES